MIRDLKTIARILREATRNSVRWSWQIGQFRFVQVLREVYRRAVRMNVEIENIDDRASFVGAEVGFYETARPNAERKTPGRGTGNSGLDDKGRSLAGTRVGSSCIRPRLND